MVSLRRKKLKEMADGAKRRSARLLALEESKSERAVLALPVDLQQKRVNRQSNLRKRGRKRTKEIDWEAQGSQDAGGNSLNNPSMARNATDRVIGYILDMLEVKDTHELFSMPDNLQTYNYEESMKQPGDFATLRQKHTDKMYPTLEHFENDVSIVFNNAINSNPPDSIPFREAMILRDHAKQIFQSLRNNLAYAELELSSWHRNYFKYKRRSLRNDPNIGNSSNASQPESSSRLAVPMDMKPHSRTNRSGSTWRHLQSVPISRSRSRRAARIEHVHPQFPEEQRRYTYKAENYSNESLFTMFCSEPKSCTYNKDTLSYQESLQHFVKDAGPIAKLVAGRKCLEYARRVQAQSIWRPSPFGSQSKIGGQPSCFPPTIGENPGPSNSSVSHSYGPTSTNISNIDCPASSTNRQHASDKFEYQSCELHTDELLSIFSLIGTPEFLESSLASCSKQELETKQGFSSFLQGSLTANSMMQMGGQSSSYKPEVPNSRTINDLSIWQPRLTGSKPWKERETAGSEQYLCPEKEVSSVSVGLYQNGIYYSFPPKPANLNTFGGPN